MANATDKVKKAAVSVVDEYFRRSVETLGAATKYYPGAILGTDITGYLCKGDDTQSWLMAGIVRADKGVPYIELPAGTAGDVALELEYRKPNLIELTVTSVAVTDIGKKVYASDDQTGVISNSALTYANLIGIIVDVVATNIALVKPAYGGIIDHDTYGASKWLAATGTQTLTKWDLNKTIFCPNTAAHTVNLPAVADTQAGDRLTFVKTTTDAQAVTLDGNSSETIDGSTTLATIDAQFDTAILVSTGSAWVVLARDIA